MVNFLYQHPDSVAFFTIFTSMFVYGFSRNRIYTSRVNSLKDRLLLIMPKGLDAYADVQFNLNKVVSTKKECGNLELLNKNIKKGYDFIRVTQDIGSHVPLHKHKRTNELFYVLEGKIDIYNCGRNTSAEECINSCINKVTLSEGESLFIKSGNEHCVMIIEPAKYLIIAKPPLFSRIGKLYEFLFKKEEEDNK